METKSSNRKREAKEFETNLKRGKNENREPSLSDDDLDSELDKSFNLFQNFLSKTSSNDAKLLKDITINSDDTEPLPTEKKYQFNLNKLLNDKKKSAVYKLKDDLVNENTSEDTSSIDYNLDNIEDIIDSEKTDRVKQIIKEDVLDQQKAVFRFFKLFNSESIKSLSTTDKPLLNPSINQSNWLNLSYSTNPQLLLSNYQLILSKIKQKDTPIEEVFDWLEIKENLTKLGTDKNIFDNNAKLADFLLVIPLKSKKLSKRESKANSNLLFPHYYLNLNLKLILQLVKSRKTELPTEIIEEIFIVSLLMIIDDSLLKHFDVLTQLIALLIDNISESPKNSKPINQLIQLFPTINTQSIDNLDWLLVFLQNLPNSTQIIRNFKNSLVLKVFKNCCKFEFDQNEWNSDYNILDINAIILPEHNKNTPFKTTKQTNYQEFSNILKLTNLLITPNLFNPKHLFSIQKLGDYLHGLHGSIVDNRAANLDKTYVKDQLQTLYLKLYYYKHFVKSNNLDQSKITDFF